MIIRVLFKILKASLLKFYLLVARCATIIKLIGNGVNFKSDLVVFGIPMINVNLKGVFTIGSEFICHNGKYFNVIGRQQPCYFIVGKNARLEIGNNVGISSSAIICYNSIHIGDNVKLGGNVVIYDTDFHSLDPLERNADPEITDNITTKPVIIEDGVFIGAHSTILKGVSIGHNSIIGAGSVVTKNIPSKQIWAGNPIKFIKNIN